MRARQQVLAACTSKHALQTADGLRFCSVLIAGAHILHRALIRHRQLFTSFAE